MRLLLTLGLALAAPLETPPAEPPRVETAPAAAAPATAAPATASPAGAQAVENPHQPGAACESCHVGQTEALQQPVVALCRSCHPTADMHPVGIVPQQTRVPEGWPLESGQLTCATCHLEPAHSEGPAPPRPYHREGPYPETTTLCFRCHERTDYQRQNPHRQDSAAADTSCSACHTRRPAEGASAAEARLRQPGSALCQGCHPLVPHLGASAHLGRSLPGGVGLPADGRGQIACFTCHDAHQHAVLDGPSTGPNTAAVRARALESDWAGLPAARLRWPGEGDADHPPMLALPLAQGQLCRACHGEGP